MKSCAVVGAFDDVPLGGVRRELSRGWERNVESLVTSRPGLSTEDDMVLFVEFKEEVSSDARRALEGAVMGKLSDLNP